MADRCQPAWAREVSCEIRFDDLNRALYATDASVYQITPIGVAFPKSAAEAASVISAAAEAGVSITPRGAGTGLAGGAVGDGLVVDFSRYNRDIWDLNREARTVRVGAGVVLDQLNVHLRPHGLCFGPDVATSSRATLGGMIANNSSGNNAPTYGTTVDHVRSVEMILADGRVVTAGPNSAALAAERAEADRLVERYAKAIRQRMPDVLLKRWPGYQFDHYLRHPGDLSKLIAGSEGTLAGIMSAGLNLVPLPRHRGLAVICFA
ncbi:MAG: FAD-binding oxidoreductase, partial [Phycisphaerales bacterium]